MTSIESYTTNAGRRWMVRYTKPNNRPTKKRGFLRKMDAERWAAEHVTVAKAKGSYVDVSAGRIRISDLYPAWLEAKRVRCKPSYTHTLEGTWTAHLEERWGNVRVGDVTREDVQQWVTLLTNGIEDKGASGKAGGTVWIERPLSASVVIRAYGILAGILDAAVADGRIPVNRARGVELPRKRRKQHRYLTAEELFALADGAKWRHDIILALGLCGMRWGELVPLRVGDVDLERRRIRISVSAPMVGGELVPDDTKTYKARTIMFPSALDTIMRGRCEGRGSEELVFEAPGKPGEMIREYGGASGGDGWMATAMRRAGIPGRMTIHDLRHTAASLMIGSGANVKAVQRQLGHASAAMTLDVYADLFDDDLDALAGRMGELLENVPKSCPNGGSDGGGC